MNPVSPEPAARARNFHALALQRISVVGQNRIAEVIGVSAPTVSRAVGDDLERICQILAAAGLKVVPAEMQCFPPAKVKILLDLARDHLNTLQQVEQLQWDEMP